MADRVFVPARNVLVNLDVAAPGARQVAEMLTFLARSRVSYAITASPAMSIAVLRDFWTDIGYDSTVDPPTLRTTVGNRPIAFTAARLRHILRLGTDEEDTGPIEFPEAFIEGALARMGYVGPRRGRNFNKSFVYGQWRFLWHIMATVFGARKSGHDELSPALLSALLSLVYHKPMGLSQYIFDMFVSQVTGNTKSHFLLYPRFTMLIIRDLIPDFPPVPPSIHVNVMGLGLYNTCFTNDKRKPEPLRPAAQNLFGYLVNPNYIAPPNDGWLDDDIVVPPPPAVADVVPSPGPQELLEDVLIQAGQEGQQLQPELVEQLVQEVIERHEDDNNPDLQDIEQFNSQEAEAEAANLEVLRLEAEQRQKDRSEDLPPKDSDVGHSGGRDGDPASDDSSATDSDPSRPALGDKRKAKDFDPDMFISDDVPEEEVTPLFIQRRKRSRTVLIPDVTQDTPQPEPVPSVVTKPISMPTQAETTTVSSFAASLLEAALSQPSQPLTTEAHVASLTPPGPSTFSVTPSTDVERITALETTVKELKKLTGNIPELREQNLLLSQQVLQQSHSYNTLMKTHKTLLDDFTTCRRQLDHLERLVLRVNSGRSAQGEILLYHESCREDELRKKQDEDRDDDPNAPTGGEPTGPSPTGKLPTRKGESARASGSGAEPSDVQVTEDAGKDASV